MILTCLVLFLMIHIVSGYSSTVTGKSARKMLSTVRNSDSSSVQEVQVYDRRCFIKRDDLLNIGDAFESSVCGNKARKCKTITTINSNAKHILSYGGFQSNAMRSLALLCQRKSMQFTYLTTSIPSWLKSNPIGNYKDTITTNANIIEIKKKDNYQQLLTCYRKEDLYQHSSLQPYLSQLEHVDFEFVRQGISSPIAKAGIVDLCDELLSFITSYQNEQLNDSKDWKILFATGTGVTAYYANEYFANMQQSDQQQPKVEVIAIPCATTSDGLKEDLIHYHNKYHSKVDADESVSTCLLSTILGSTKARVFSAPCPEHLSIWQDLQKQSQIPFDLIYAPRAFEILLEHDKLARMSLGESDQQEEIRSLQHLYSNSHLLYYHCGGVEGNESQLARYRYLKLV